ncbi:hypothetical protein NDU88_001834, partial [Pleurodeles waltl]
HPCYGDHGGVEGLQILPDLLLVFLLQPLVLLHVGEDLAHLVLGLLVSLQDISECLLESR